MALDNLAGLRAAALAWIERTGDPAADTIVNDCVALCESRVNKTPDFRLAEMETEAVLALVNERAALPPDFLAMKRVVSNTSPTRLLSYAEPGWYSQAYPNSGTDESSGFYTITGVYASPPSPAGPQPPQQTLYSRSPATLSVIYYAKVPTLAVVDPNWLLIKSPDVYLYGTIMELLNALEGEGVEKYAGLFGGALESLIQSQTYSRGGVLTQRASMPAP
jgi:hypothetical protein